MITAPATVGARCIDSLPFSNGGTAAQAVALKAAAVDCVIGYLGAISAARVQAVIDAGLAFMPVTFAGAYNGMQAVSQCKSLALPAGCTVWLDLEGSATLATPPQELATKVNVWAATLIEAGFVPGLYVGAPQPFTSEELYHLKVQRYWKSGSRILDRNGRLAEPGCGWCLYQLLPQGMWRDTGVFVDVDFVQTDYRGRLPAWAVG